MSDVPRSTVSTEGPRCSSVEPRERQQSLLCHLTGTAYVRPSVEGAFLTWMLHFKLQISYCFSCLGQFEVNKLHHREGSEVLLSKVKRGPNKGLSLLSDMIRSVESEDLGPTLSPKV